MALLGAVMLEDLGMTCPGGRGHAAGNNLSGNIPMLRSTAAGGTFLTMTTYTWTAGAIHVCRRRLV